MCTNAGKQHAEVVTWTAIGLAAWVVASLPLGLLMGAFLRVGHGPDLELPS